MLMYEKLLTDTSCEREASLSGTSWAERASMRSALSTTSYHARNTREMPTVRLLFILLPFKNPHAEPRERQRAARRERRLSAANKRTGLAARRRAPQVGASSQPPVQHGPADVDGPVRGTP